MPPPVPPVTDSLSVLSIRRVASPMPKASVMVPSALGNASRPHAWEPNVGSGLITGLPTPHRRMDSSCVLPCQLVWGQQDGGATLAPLVVDANTGVSLNAQQDQILETCSWQLRLGWRNFRQELVTHALSDLDPSWPPASRAVFERAAHKLLQDKAPSELPEQPVFACFLEQPGCMRALLPAAMKWLEAHVDVLEQSDIARTGSSAVTTEKYAYLDGMAALLGGRFSQALADTTLLKMLDALHEDARALAERVAVQNVSGAEWAAWAHAQGFSRA